MDRQDTADFGSQTAGHVRVLPKVFSAIVAATLVLVGLLILLVIPTACEGPLLLYINELHSVRLVDAIGLAVAVPAWLYLNVLIVRLWRKRGNR